MDKNIYWIKFSGESWILDRGFSARAGEGEGQGAAAVPHQAAHRARQGGEQQLGPRLPAPAQYTGRRAHHHLGAILTLGLMSSSQLLSNWYFRKFYLTTFINCVQNICCYSASNILSVSIHILLETHVCK